MARKKGEPDKTKKVDDSNVVGLQAQVLEQPIVDTLEVNFMPYAMSVIVSRAIPEIDGFKPSHRKLLYTMYKMGLLTGKRTKSANIVGQTMRLNPHGDSAIYETMVRLSKGHEALLTPFVDSKGNFGKTYSRDMAYAASRYTEAKLSDICSEFFRDIDRDTVDFQDNYDGTMQEPALLPTSFPNVLASANQGIAVGMASMICGFNLAEVCQTTIAYIKDEHHNIMSTLPAPDFTTGGEIIMDVAEMQRIYETGRGSFKVRARWRHIPAENLIEIYEIPYTTSIEAIIDKVAELIKSGKVREISDMRDETDLGGLKITIDLKRGTDPEKLMQKLYKQTPLLDSFPCNFNILISGMLRVIGVREILDEWIAWRIDSVKRRVYHELRQKKEKLHLLTGLKKILLDIDRAIEIIRNTDEESEVVPNLMIGFGIDELQAEFVAEIKLRNINRAYILKRTAETDELAAEIADLEETLGSKAKIKKIIIKELERVSDKYGTPRKTGIVYTDELETYAEEEDIPDYPVTVFVSREGYLKKITPQSLRMSGEQKYKESDGPKREIEAGNRDELLVFTDHAQVYKTRLSEFEDSKASLLGSFLPTALEMEEGESVLHVEVPGDYRFSVLFFFENGKVARVDAAAYETKTNRKKLTKAFSDKSPVRSIIAVREETDIVAYSTEGRAILFNTALLSTKTSRATQGVGLMTLKPKYQLKQAQSLLETAIVNTARYRARSLPVAGSLLKEEDMEEKQMNLLEP